VTTTPDWKAEGPHWKADAYLLATAMMWGVNIPVVKEAITRLDPFLFNASRLVFSAIALALMVWIEWRSGYRQLAPTPWPKVLLFAFMTGFVYQILFMLGITRTTAGNTALLLATMPVWTAILSYFFFHERLARVTWLGLLVTLTGTTLVVVSGGKVSGRSEYLWGNLFMLLASMLWAVGTVYSRPLLRDFSPLRLSLVSNGLFVPLHLALAPIWMQFPTKEYEPWQQVLFEPAILTAIIYSGAFSTGLAYATWNIGVRQLGGSHAAVYQNIVTLVAVLGGWLFLKESVLAVQIVGGVVMLLGLYLMRRGRR
jgi:drug/metabolite transporter (DMT)-like permease